MEIKTKDIKTKLLQKDIKPTMQRLEIYKYLLGEKKHVSCEEVYDMLKEDGSVISRATVYNTLNLFTEKGLLMEVNFERKETRYDINVMEHGHFACKECGGIWDIFFDEKRTLPEEMDGFEIETAQYSAIGVCKDCLKSVRKIS